MLQIGRDIAAPMLRAGRDSFIVIPPRFHPALARPLRSYTYTCSTVIWDAPLGCLKDKFVCVLATDLLCFSQELNELLLFLRFL